MGWYGNSGITCPKCGEKKASEIYRSIGDESYYLICSGCGLHLHAEYKQWVVTGSYIDESIIDKNLEELDSPELLVDTFRNENVIPKGEVL